MIQAGDDQYGLRMHPGCGRLVLNEFNQLIAVNHFPRCYRNTLAGHIALCTGRWIPTEMTLNILPPIAGTAHQVLSALFKRLAPEPRDWSEKVARG